MTTPPSLYSNPESRMDTVGSFTTSEINFWQQIRRANREFQKQKTSVSEPDNFVGWMLEHWGIRLQVLDNGNYSPEFEIIEPDKYTLFLLKYS